MQDGEPVVVAGALEVATERCQIIADEMMPLADGAAEADPPGPRPRARSAVRARRPRAAARRSSPRTRARATPSCTWCDRTTPSAILALPRDVRVAASDEIVDAVETRARDRGDVLPVSGERAQTTARASGERAHPGRHRAAQAHAAPGRTSRSPSWRGWPTPPASRSSARRCRRSAASTRRRSSARARSRRSGRRRRDRSATSSSSTTRSRRRSSATSRRRSAARSSTAASSSSTSSRSARARLEGKLQVELAQLQYLLPRLTRAVDAPVAPRRRRRHARPGRDAARGRPPARARAHRAAAPAPRATSRARAACTATSGAAVPFPTVALVGYTNAGKSTLMNALTHAGVLVEDRLFATLDPTVRRLRLPARADGAPRRHGRLHPQAAAPARRGVQEHARGGARRRPAAARGRRAQPAAGRSTRASSRTCSSELGADGRPRLLRSSTRSTCCRPGRARPGAGPARDRDRGTYRAGLPALLDGDRGRLTRGLERVRCEVPPERGDLLAWLRRTGRIVEEYYRDGAVTVTALVPPKIAGQLRKRLAPRRGRARADRPQLPNFLTLLRIVAIPAFLILLEDCDYGRGAWRSSSRPASPTRSTARSRGSRTPRPTLGAYLDPAADKLLLRLGLHRPRLHARGAALARR